jgi:hypothetical protein
MQQKVSLRRRILKAASSSRFFWAIVLFMVLQASWIALSARYPMAFDEDFHFGIIRIYAHHLSPFLSGQPAGADAYGAVARDPSYLYHYLMSFPYRLISVFISNQTAQVIGLRFVNIALMASGLVVYRRLLLKVGASRAITNFCVLIFVLLPVVPLLAGQINYDNLLLPVSGLALLAAVELVDELSDYRRINVKLLIITLILCLLASLIKYAFLPIFLAIGLYFLFGLKRAFPTFRKLLGSFGFGFSLMTQKVRWLLVVALVISSGLFIQRYGVNVVRYHTPVPDCSKVLSVKECSAYGPWIRDYDFKINKVDEEHSPFVFTADWVYGMWLRLFFSLGGPSTDYQTRGPLPVGAVAAIGFAILGLGVVIRYGRRVYRRHHSGALWLLAVAAIFYIGTLWLDEYLAYVRTGQPVAINGRYLLPVLLPLFMLIALATKEALREKPALKLELAGIAVISLLWGGGALTYILRSNDTWNWPNQAVLKANHAVQNTLGPVTPGYYEQTLFLK